MTNSIEKELLAAVFAVLNNDSELKNSTGIDPKTGSARAVQVFNMVTPDQPVPYCRISLTDTRLMEAEPYEYDFEPTIKAVALIVNAFSDYEPEVFGISSRLQQLLQHREITTDHFHGSTWLTSADYYVDNTSSPDHVYRVAALRIQARLEPL